MRILLAVDGSDASMSAVATTAALPLARGSAIEVVSVIPDWFAPEGSSWPAVIRMEPPPDRERVYDDIRGRLAGIADRLKGDGVSVEVQIREGRPASEIIIEAGRFGADLIVVGARGLSAVRRVLVGSVSAEVVDHAPCPVLVARRPAAERILVATDGSPDADRAADFIADCGLFDDAEIRVLSVADAGMPWWTGLSPVDGMTSIEVYGDALESARHRATSVAEQAATRLRGHHVTAVPARPDGDIASTIVAEAGAWRADIVALGSRSMGSLHRFLIGGVSRAVLHHAPMSVLIVRPRTGAAVGPPQEGVEATSA
jgi:nucleotide-binding universal stress UspA family protein